MKTFFNPEITTTRFPTPYAKRMMPVGFLFPYKRRLFTRRYQFTPSGITVQFCKRRIDNPNFPHVHRCFNWNSWHYNRHTKEVVLIGLFAAPYHVLRSITAL